MPTSAQVTRGVPLIGMTYYNPFLAYWLAGGALRSFALSTVPDTATLDRELTAIYGGAKRTADVEGKFSRPISRPL